MTNDEKISQGICVSDRGVDHCPVCTDRCDAAHFKMELKELTNIKMENKFLDIERISNHLGSCFRVKQKGGGFFTDDKFILDALNDYRPWQTGVPEKVGKYEITVGKSIRYAWYEDDIWKTDDMEMMEIPMRVVIAYRPPGSPYSETEKE